MVVSVVNLKGGAGKTTSVMCLAAVAAGRGADVVVLDADPELSAYGWFLALAAAENPLPFEVIPIDGDELASKTREVAKSGRTVLLDTPPNDRQIVWPAASVSDVVLVPTEPSEVNLTRLGSTLRLLAEIEASRGDRPLNAMVLLLRTRQQRLLARESVQALMERDLPVLEATVRDLERYKRFEDALGYLDEYEEVWDELVASLEG